MKQWLKQGTSPSKFVSTLCKTDKLSCDNKRWQPIERHMSNKKYHDNRKLIKGNYTQQENLELIFTM